MSPTAEAGYPAVGDPPTEGGAVTQPRWHPKWRREPVAQPAAGANFVRKNDSAGLWIVRGLAFRLVTSAVVANRVVTLRATAAEDIWFRTSAGGVQAASLTVDYAAWPGSGAPAGTTPTALLGWPTDGLWLPPGHDLASEVALLDVGDQLSAIILDIVEYPDTSGERLTPFPYAYRAEET